MRKESKLCPCPLEGIIDVVSKKWSLLTINAIGNAGRIRYNGIMELLEGVSPKTLADTLKVLMKFDLIKRQAFAEVPPRVEYSLTEDGAKLRGAIMPLLRWAASKTPEKKCPILIQPEIQTKALRKRSS